MRVKSFKDQLEQKLNPDEIAELERSAQIEYETLINLQQDISQLVVNYMATQNVHFNELVRRLGKSPTQVSKILKGEANLTSDSQSNEQNKPRIEVSYEQSERPVNA